MNKNLSPYIILCITVVVVVLFGVSTGSRVHQSSKIKLVVLISADQFPYEYVTRFGTDLTGGIGRLLRSGTLYSNAYFDHAVTNTCPGHATIATGTHPSEHGVVDNWWFDRKSKSELYCVGKSSEIVSPALLRAHTIGDEMKRIYGKSKVHTVAGKDRAAVMLGGQFADAAWWFDKSDGGFTTSNYYKESVPPWVVEHNKNHLLEGFGTLWRATGMLLEDRERLKIKALKRGRLQSDFPYPYGGLSLIPNGHFFRAVYGSPLIDSYTNRFAQSLLVHEQLGEDSSPDFLGVSFSALDTVGHNFGPNAEETYDTLQQLDQQIAELLSVLDDSIGLDKVLVVFTSDHGVKPYPEFAKEARRIDSNDIACFQEAGASLIHTYGPVLLDSHYFDHSYIKDIEIDLQGVKQHLRSELAECEIVERLIFEEELSSPQDDSLKLWRNSHFKGRSPDFYIQFKEHVSTHFPDGTGHGSAYDHDRHVPVVFMGPGFESTVEGRPYSITEIKSDILNQLKAQTP